MSFDRQRAIEVRAESTRTAGRPAFALAWFVSSTSCCSEAALNDPASQAKVEVGATRTAAEPTANAIAAPIGARRDRPGARTIDLHGVAGPAGLRCACHARRTVRAGQPGRWSLPAPTAVPAVAAHGRDPKLSSS